MNAVYEMQPGISAEEYVAGMNEFIVVMDGIRAAHGEILTIQMQLYTPEHWRPDQQVISTNLETSTETLRETCRMFVEIYGRPLRVFSPVRRMEVEVNNINVDQSTGILLAIHRQKESPMAEQIPLTSERLLTL